MGKGSKREIIYDPPPDSRMLGVARALCAISDAVVMVHGRSCCHADSLLFGAMTSRHDRIRVLGSGLRGQDISTGGSRKLSLAIRSAWKEFEPAIIAVLIASVPTMMGDDVEGTIDTLRKDIPAEIVTFPCAGYEGSSCRGYEEALSRLVDFMAPCPVKGEKINLLGLKGDQPGVHADLREITRILALQGIGVNSVLALCSFREIMRAPQAALNVVIGGDGRDCASLMEERFGIPFIGVPYPYGYGQSVEFITRICEALGKEPDHGVIEGEKDSIREALQKVYAYLQGIYGLPVAVAGEGGRALHLARFLGDELGLEVKLLAVTTKGHGLIDGQETAGGVPGSPADPADLLLAPDHYRMSEAIRERGVEMIFGSTMEKRLARELEIPLVRAFYPVLDAVCISDHPSAGFRGVVNLVETTVNAAIGQAWGTFHEHEERCDE